MIVESEWVSTLAPLLLLLRDTGGWRRRRNEPPGQLYTVNIQSAVTRPDSLQISQLVILTNHLGRLVGFKFMTEFTRDNWTMTY